VPEDYSKNNNLILSWQNVSINHGLEDCSISIGPFIDAFSTTS
jgi:hypothetical protein